MAGTRISKRRIDRRSVRGMSLVELIVVLVILAILASAGIVSSVGYARRAIIEQNQSNAVTIYQAAQTALQQLNKSGGIQSTMGSNNGIISEDLWVGYVTTYGKHYTINDNNLSPTINSGNKDKYTSLYSSTVDVEILPNSSAHMIYVLTYYRTNTDDEQNKLVKELIQPYFADSTVFQGTIAIELDVEKSADAYGKIHLSAKCLSVFFDGRAKSGWASKAFKVNDAVPTREEDYRLKTSFIGYYDGYKGAGVDTVYLPKVEQGIAVQNFFTEYDPVPPPPDPNVTPPADPNPDPGTTTTSPAPTATPTPVIHTRLTWAATIDHATLENKHIDHESLLGYKQPVYYRIVLKEVDSVKNVLILNEEFLLDKDNIDGTSHSFDYLTEFKNKSTRINGYDVGEPEEYTAVYPGNITKKVTRKSIEVMAKVFVSSNADDGTGSSEKDDYKKKSNDAITPVLMPLRITYVTIGPETPSPDNSDEIEDYIEYSLDLTGEGDAYVLTGSMTEAVLTIHPNYFTDPIMAGINDKSGIIPFKKGKNTEIDQEQTKLPDDTNTESSP
ncbi:MAG: type II secretion system GspH family protein [Saccharofermentans sp.]|nr:type II secretion system GspH family protein [Saccharofermentans sp.]